MDAKRRLSFFMGIGMVFFPGANGNNSWIDIETPLKKRTTKSLVDGSTYHLVRLFLSLCTEMQLQAKISHQTS
jgi:hypothetical protein